MYAFCNAEKFAYIDRGALLLMNKRFLRCNENAIKTAANYTYRARGIVQSAEKSRFTVPARRP